MAPGNQNSWWVLFLPQVDLTRGDREMGYGASWLNQLHGVWFDEESLNWLDRGLAKRLEFMCNLSIPSLTDIDIPPAAKTLIFTPGARTVLKTKAMPSVFWAPKTSWWTRTNGCCFAYPRGEGNLTKERQWSHHPQGNSQGVYATFGMLRP